MTARPTTGPPTTGPPTTVTPTTLLPTAGGRQVRRQLVRLMRGRRGLLTAAVAVLAADSVLQLVGPVAIGWITGDVTSHRGAGALIAPLTLLVAAVPAAAVTGWAAAVLLGRVTLPMAARLREATIAAALELPVEVVEAGGTGDLVSRVSGDVERVTEAAEGTLDSFAGAALTIVGSLIGLAALDWRFALAGLLAVPIQVQALRWYLGTARPIYAAGRVADGRRASALLAGFTALPTVRALRLGARQRDLVAAASSESIDCELRATGVATRFYGRLNVAELIGLSAILLAGFVLVRDGLASVGATTTAGLFFAGLFGPVNTLLGTFDSIQQAGAGLGRLVGVIQAGEVTVGGPEAGAVVRDSGFGFVFGTGCGSGSGFDSGSESGSACGGAGIGATGVCFGYGGGPDVLHDVSLELAGGRHLAIVGSTGSGKSTFAALLAGLREPRAGIVSRGGTVALVTQETHVFAGTLADNLRLVRPAATDDAITAALAAVGARWAGALPHGIDTLVGAGGAALTASQAQQLALARLLLLDPDIVILDEATAEAGSDAARTLDRAAETVIAGRTAVVIAHRLSQAAGADVIYVMEGGRVIERGGHDELRAANGTYAALWSAWSG
jgi:ABC-type multidrug transport system fused ATPase/permease subunit